MKGRTSLFLDMNVRLAEKVVNKSDSLVAEGAPFFTKIVQDFNEDFLSSKEVSFFGLSLQAPRPFREDRRRDLEERSRRQRLQIQLSFRFLTVSIKV